MIRLPIFILLWGGFVAIKLVTMLLGLVIVPFLFKHRSVLYSQLPGWTRPWANPEDWYGGHKTFEKTSLPKWWVDKKGEGFGAFYRYHAIRNPANGLRSFEFLDLDIDMDKVEYKTNFLLKYYDPWHMRKVLPQAYKGTAWYVCWQGFQAGVKYVHLWNDERHFVFKFGWRVEPKDASIPIDPTGIRVEDSGFASKLLPYRKG